MILLLVLKLDEEIVRKYPYDIVTIPEFVSYLRYRILSAYGNWLFT